MPDPDFTFYATRHRSAHEALQYLDAAGDADYAILLGGIDLTVTRAEAERRKIQLGGDVAAA